MQTFNNWTRKQIKMLKISKLFHELLWESIKSTKEYQQTIKTFKEVQDGK